MIREKVRDRCTGLLTAGSMPGAAAIRSRYQALGSLALKCLT